MTDLKNKIRSIPDFPIENVTFRDITPIMQDGEAFNNTCDIFYKRYKNKQIDKIAGIDARGFVFGSVLAYRLGIGFVPIRKKGKLPYKTISRKFNLEYGTGEVEIHEDAINKGERIVVIDDLIATGGTVAAAVKLVEQLGGEVVECAFLVELSGLNGREAIKDYTVYSAFTFEDE